MTSLLDLLQTKLTQVERCKLNTIQSSTIYAETLPSLLLQAVGFIEKLVENKKFKPLKIRKNLDGSTSEVYNFNEDIISTSFDNVVDINQSKNNIIKWYKYILPRQEFLVAVDYLSHLTLTTDDMKHRVASLKTHRNDFAHGKINARSLSIISKHDYYIYFGLLLIIEDIINL